MSLTGRVRVVVAMLVSVALAAGVLTSLPLADAGASPAPGDPPGATVAQADPAPVEVPAMRTRTSRTFQTETGFKSEFTVGSMNYEASPGDWQPIDDTLVASTSPGYRWRNRANRATVDLPADIADAPVRISDGGSWVSFALQGAQGAGAATGATVVYRSALPGVDVADTVGSDALRETLTLASPATSSTFAYTVAAAPGLSARADGGGIAVVDASGAVVFRLPKPFMDDAAGAHSDGVTFALAPAADGTATLTMAADPAWLAAPERVWPVVIDPDANFTTGTDCFTSSATPTTSLCGATTMKVGYDGTSANYRSQLRFDSVNATIPADAMVIDSNIVLTQLSSTTTNTITVDAIAAPNAFTTSATWNNYDGTHAWSALGSVVDGETVGWTNQQWAWYPTTLVQQWVNGTTPNNGVVFKNHTESSTSNVLSLGSLENATPANRPTMYVLWARRLGERGSYKYVSSRLDDRTGLKVNVANGNAIIDATDLNVSGVGLNLAWTRQMNSQYGLYSHVGNDWLFGRSEDIELQTNGDRWAQLELGADEYIFQHAPGSSTYTPPPGIDATLTHDTVAGTFTVTFNQSQEKLVMTYDGDDYELTSDTDRNGNTITYTYTSGVASGFTDSVGRTYTIAHNGSGDVSSVTDSTGRHVDYAYTSSGPELLSTVTDTGGGTTTYGYDSFVGAVNQVTTPAGHVAKLTYDHTYSPTRVSSLQFITNSTAGTGPTTTFSYDINRLSANAASMETSAAAWAASTGSPALAASTAQAQDGTHSLSMTAAAAGDMAAKTVVAQDVPVSPTKWYTAEASVRANTTGRNVQAQITWLDASNAVLSTSTGTAMADTNTGWAQPTVTAVAPTSAAKAEVDVIVKAAAASEVHYVDEAGISVGRNTRWTKGITDGKSLPTDCAGAFATRVTDPNLADTVHCYDESDRVIDSIDANFNSQGTSYAGNTDDLPTSLTDGLTQATNLVYDTTNNLTSLTSPKSSSTATAASTNINYATGSGTTGYQFLPSSMTDPQGACRAFTYDTVGNLTQVNDNQSGSGSPRSCNNTGGSSWTNAYQGDTGVTSCTSDGLTTTYKGILCSSKDPRLNSTTYAYTFAASAPKTLQSLAVTQSGGSCTPTHNLCQTSTFDALSRVSTVVAATPGSTSADTKTTYCYDNMDRILKLFYTATTTTPNCATGTADVAYTYDGDGNVTQRVDATGTTAFAYDLMGRPVTKNTGTNTCTGIVDGTTTANGTVCFAYDGANNLTSFTDSSGTTGYDAYDGANNLLKMHEPSGNCGATPSLCTNFAYDANNRRTTTTYPGGATLTVGYDNAGNETSVVGKNSGGATTISSFKYCYQALVSGACPTSGTVIDQGKVSQVIKGADSIVSPATTTDYAYDAAGRLCLATSTTPGACPLPTATPPASGNAYAYDGAGNRQWSVVGATTTHHGYDAANRVCWSKATTTSPGTACTPAPASSTTYAFDGIGALTASASPTSSFGYNAKGQATSITANSVTLSSMAYADVGQSERTSYTNGASTTSFLSTPWGLDRSTTGANSSYLVRDPAGTPVAFKDSSGNHWYYLLDGLGSVVGVINGAGSTLTDKYAYDEFGRVTSKAEATPQPLGYAGGIADPTGLVKFGERYYDPTVGRWTQQDPIGGSIGNPATVNRYAYAAGDPIDNIDPTGMCSFGCIVSTVTTGILSGGAAAAACVATAGLGCAAAVGGAVAATTFVYGVTSGESPGKAATQAACAGAGAAVGVAAPILGGVGGVACLAATQ
jgi:RHS repeat-associated protein